MTTSASLDHSTIVRQSFAELIFRTGVLCQHIDELKTETTSQIIKLENHFKRTEMLCGKGIVPLYDMENLFHFIMGRLKKFNTLLDSLVEERYRFEFTLKSYETTLKEIIEEIAND